MRDYTDAIRVIRSCEGEADYYSLRREVRRDLTQKETIGEITREEHLRLCRLLHSPQYDVNSPRINGNHFEDALHLEEGSNAQKPNTYKNGNAAVLLPQIERIRDHGDDTLINEAHNALASYYKQRQITREQLIYLIGMLHQHGEVA